MVPETALVPIASPRSARSRFWRNFAAGLWITARTIKLGGCAAGRVVSRSYHAIDPDLRKHIAQVPLVGMSLLVPRNSEVKPLPDDGYRPLVLVHGLGGSPGNFVALRAFFKSLGRTRIYQVNLTRSGSFEEMAERLRLHITQVVERNELGPEDQIDLVAHSMGGLVSRLLLMEDEIAARVNTLVTLGSPHSGSHLARYATTDVILALRPKSDLLDRLARAQVTDRDSRPRVVAMWSPADVILLPAESAQLPGAENIEMEGVTHYSYLFLPRCLRTIWDVLCEDPLP